MKKEGGLESEAVIRRRYSINGVFFNLSVCSLLGTCYVLYMTDI